MRWTGATLALWSVTALVALPLLALLPAAGELPSQAGSSTALRHLEGAEGDTPWQEICHWLAAARQCAPLPGDLASRLLKEQHPVYRERPRPESQLIRAAIFCALANQPLDAANRAAVDSELSVGHEAIAFAAAARLAGTLTELSDETIKCLARPFQPGFMDTVCSLEDVTQQWPLRSPTTARREAVRALASQAGRSSLAQQLLESLVAQKRIDEEQLATWAQGQLAKTVSTGACRCCGPAQSSSPQVVSLSGKSPLPGTLSFTDQQGHTHQLAEYQDKPLLVTFFYSRCDNPRKCARTLADVAALQAALHAQGNPAARVLVVTYDPVYDDTLRLNALARQYGFSSDQGVTLARFSSEQAQELVHHLDCPVSYVGGVVSLHGLHTVLLGRGLLPVKQYEQWKVDEVVRELQGMGK